MCLSSPTRIGSGWSRCSKIPRPLALPGKLPILIAIRLGVRVRGATMALIDPLWSFNPPELEGGLQRVAVVHPANWVLVVVHFPVSQISDDVRSD